MSFRGVLRALALLLTLLSLSAPPREASAHAWAKQKPVLFMSAEVSEERLRLTLCLPAPLLNQVLTQPIDVNYTLTPELQTEVYGQLERYFQSHNPILVDGVRVRPNLSALDLVLSAPLDEVEAAALAPNTKLHSGNEGAAILTLDVSLKGTPKLLSLRWDSDVLWTRGGRRSASQLTSKLMPGVLVYQDELSPIKLTPEEPEQLWRPSTPHLRPPSPAALELSPPPPPPAWHAWGWWLLFALSSLPLIALKRANTRLRLALSLSALALLGAGGASLRALGAPLPFSQGDNQGLSDEQARAILEALHSNIYRAFDYERDEEVYDALAESVTGPLLDWVFQEINRSLILKEEGGAQAKVSLVKPLEWSRRPLNDKEREALKGEAGLVTRGAFACEYRWRVVGEVTHWGHSHRRVNDYKARYAVAHTAQGWRLVSVKRMGHARRPELEGGLEGAQP